MPQTSVSIPRELRAWLETEAGVWKVSLSKAIVRLLEEARSRRKLLGGDDE